jgi:hypothetical protein
LTAIGLDERWTATGRIAAADLHLPADRIFRWQVGIALALTVLYVVTQSLKIFAGKEFVFGLVPMFDLDAEANLPTFFQSQTLLACGVALAVVAVNERVRGAAQALRWLGLGLAFVYLGADEAAMLHDRMGPPAMQLFGQGPNHIDWVLPMGLLAGAFALWILPLLFAIPRRTALAFVVAGIVYVSGAVGFEIVGKFAAEAAGYASFTYVLTVVCEEGLEMLGVALMLRAVLRYVAENGYSLRIGAS